MAKDTGFIDPAATAKIDAAKQADADAKKAKADADAEAERKRQQTPAQPAAAPGAVTLTSEQFDGLTARLAAAEARLSSIQAPPPPPAPSGPDGSHDLDKYNDGELTSRADGKTKFRMRYVANDLHGKPYHLKNKTHFFQAANVAELRDHFDGELLSQLEKRERIMADKAAKAAGAHVADDEDDE